jgi:hypothetical protein
MPIEELMREFAELIGRSMAERWIGRRPGAEDRSRGRPSPLPPEVRPTDPRSADWPIESARSDWRRDADEGEP